MATWGWLQKQSIPVKTSHGYLLIQNKQTVFASMHYFNVPYTVLALQLLQCTLSLIITAVNSNLVNLCIVRKPWTEHRGFTKLLNWKEACTMAKIYFFNAQTSKCDLSRQVSSKQRKQLSPAFSDKLQFCNICLFSAASLSCDIQAVKNMCGNKMNIYYFAFTSQYSVSLIAPN